MVRQAMFVATGLTHDQSTWAHAKKLTCNFKSDGSGTQPPTIIGAADSQVQDNIRDPEDGQVPTSTVAKKTHLNKLLCLPSFLYRCIVGLVYYRAPWACGISPFNIIFMLLITASKICTCIYLFQHPVSDVSLTHNTTGFEARAWIWDQGVVEEMSWRQSYITAFVAGNSSASEGHLQGGITAFVSYVLLYLVFEEVVLPIVRWTTLLERDDLVSRLDSYIEKIDSDCRDVIADVPAGSTHYDGVESELQSLWHRSIISRYRTQIDELKRQTCGFLELVDSSRGSEVFVWFIMVILNLTDFLSRYYGTGIAAPVMHMLACEQPPGTSCGMSVTNSALLGYFFWRYFIVDIFVILGIGKRCRGSITEITDDLPAGGEGREQSIAFEACCSHLTKRLMINSRSITALRAETRCFGGGIPLAVLVLSVRSFACTFLYLRQWHADLSVVCDAGTGINEYGHILGLTSGSILALTKLLIGIISVKTSGIMQRFCSRRRPGA